MAEYVSNKLLYEHLKKRKQENADRLTQGLDLLPVDNYMGECILKIATHLAYKANFVGYSYRNEMVGDGIEKALKAIDKFDPDRGTNPFAYITQVCFNAFVNRINLEKKQQKIRGRILEEMPIDQMFDIQDHDGDEHGFHNQAIEFLREHNYIDTTDKPKRKRKIQLAEEETLSEFIDEIVDEVESGESPEDE
jgi:DNA-directed RNA polymerase specialized sigma24 family protein